MKKKLVASLAAAMVLGVAGTSFAAANPFVDVPAKHWAYASVTTLSQAGIVDGYADGKFMGDKMISRYEMAQIVAKAMAKSDKADATQKAMIDKLAVEFASELEGLNVRVSKLEKNASSVKVTGYARVRFQETLDRGTDLAGTGTEATAKDFVLRTRLFVNGNINDQWTYAGRLENNQNLYSAAADNGTDFNMATVSGPLAGTTATFGRMDLTPVYGYVMDESLKGAKFSFGNAVKANVYHGKVVDASANLALMEKDYVAVVAADTVLVNATQLTLTGADVKYATSKATNLVGGFWQYDATKTQEDKFNIWEAGFDSNIADNLVLKADYIKSNADADNKGYVAGLTYKAANVKKVESFSVWANYRNIKQNVLIDGLTTLDNAQLKGTNDGKGYEVGFNYVPATNSILTFKYVDTKGIADETKKAKFYRAQAEFFF